MPGLDAADAGLLDPPDVQVGSGPSRVMELTNGAGRIWRIDAAGGPQAPSTFALGDFFDAGVASDRLADPRVLYDAVSNRWFASAFDTGTNTILLNVSRTPDPEGPWALYTFGSTACPDQPRIGFDDDVVVIAADLFTNCADTEIGLFLGGKTWVVNKADLVAGRRPAAFVSFGPDGRYSSLTPVQSLGAATTEFAVSVDDVSSRVVHLLDVTGVPPAAVNVTEVATLPIRRLDSPPPARQPDGTPLETNDNRVLDAVREGDRIALTANGACVPAGETATRACARVVALSATAPRAVATDVDLAPGGADAFFPAVRIDADGNLAVVFGLSSPTAFPSVAVVGISPTGLQTPPVLVGAGTTSHRTARYGDYFGAARDPTDPRRIWVAGELGTAALGWSTVVGSVTVNVPEAPPPDTTPPTVKALTATARRGRVVRLRYRVSDHGGATREIVTVRRRGKVSRTVRTQVSAKSLRGVAWRAPRRPRGPYTFCVRARDAAGNTSALSCAPIRIR